MMLSFLTTFILITVVVCAIFFLLILTFALMYLTCLWVFEYVLGMDFGEGS